MVVFTRRCVPGPCKAHAGDSRQCLTNAQYQLFGDVVVYNEQGVNLDYAFVLQNCSRMIGCTMLQLIMVNYQGVGNDSMTIFLPF